MWDVHKNHFVQDVTARVISDFVISQLVVYEGESVHDALNGGIDGAFAVITYIDYVKLGLCRVSRLLVGVQYQQLIEILLFVLQ